MIFLRIWKVKCLPKKNPCVKIGVDLIFLENLSLQVIILCVIASRMGIFLIFGTQFDLQNPTKNNIPSLV